MTFEYISKSIKDTEILAENIESNKFENMVICLNGDLGSGKTLFAKAFAKSMGISKNVTSPTFTIVKEYYDGDMPLFHMDLYRVAENNEEFGIEEYYEENGICLIEWSNLCLDKIPLERLNIEFEITSENQRLINITAYGEKYIRLCEESI